ncbi:MAG: WbqC family protein [gamma proteobacterium symbiont of Bathyaustriella thionipta]|nr:WbqC family protein [gamma proteobacterium symbiont of Bathyaustriella thionipta]MCU7949289.1 WbqC family protein [gamma proteobacterium symbiont of Bathyaustriella thionipta]MCU7953997.1 WbqC family protein [gamma proteobacterium symbiont of Bathyaustriella thionipta]MCU7955892.1 WbqC family protein [gamma proteobacterium symbiont of Bathyaustriella thionipta]MCU7966386.1 WbqC family protein [gamma proteobacterium symbiont of Bathyaustriella thionipta]
MILAIMQPYLFPYIGYWQLIANSDEFIFFDVVQYNKRSWMNRNRILYPDESKEFQYVSVAIKKHSKGTLISDVVLNNAEKWQQKILGQLTVYKKFKAPFYNETIDLIKKLFSKDYESFISLSIESTKIFCNYLDINLKYKKASDLNFDKKKIEGPGDWALEISKELNATEYINPYGGYEIFDEDKYNSNCIDISFLKPNLTPYKQSWRKDFQAGLSIIDVLMFNSKEDVKKLLLSDFKKLTKKDLVAIYE